MQMPVRRFAPLLVLLAAFALRITQLTFQPLWFDEGWSVWFATSSLPEMVERTAVDIHPPLYYAVLHFWVGAAGAGEFSLRLLSALIGVAGVAMIYALARQLLGGSAGLLAGALTAIAPLQVYYSQEIRMYGLVTLLGVASSWLFWKGLHAEYGKAGVNGRRRWVWYVLVTGAAMHTQYYGAFIPLFHLVFWTITLVGGRRARFTFRGSYVMAPLLSLLAAGLLFLPWALYAGPKLVAYVADKIVIEQYVSLSPVDYAARHLVAFSAGHLPSDVAWFGWVSVIFLIAGVLGVISQAANHVSRITSQNGTLRQSGSSPIAPDTALPTLFLVLYLFIPVLGAYLVQVRFPFAPPRMERLLLLASPPFLMLVARGLTEIYARSQSASSRLRRLAASGAPTLIVAISVFALIPFYFLPRYPEQDYRPLANRINALALPDDVVICVHPWQMGFLRAYLTVPARLQMVASPAWGGEVQAQLDHALSGERRLWLPAYQTLGRILESEMEVYLKQRAFPVEAKWYEQTRLLFFASPSPETLTQTLLETSLGNLSINAILTERDATSYPSGWGIAPLGFLASKPAQPPKSARISVRLKDRSGRSVASQDREFETQDLPDSIQWKSGFLIPAGTIPGEYQITVTLYDASLQTIGQEVALRNLTVARPATPPPVSALPIQTPLTANWRDMRLVGYTLREGGWQAGETIRLDSFWQVLDAPRQDYILFLQVQDVNGRVHALSEAKPAYATANWQRGDLIREQSDLQLPAALPPGRYRIVAGWLREASRERLALADGGNHALVREIDVRARPRQMTPPTPQTKQDIRFAAVAKIVGYDLALDPQKKLLTLRLYWQASSEMDTAYKVFAHVVPVQGNTPAAQHDSPPANGSLPTTGWIRGEYIADEHAITLPDALPTGRYRILVGLYDPQSGARVPAFAADGRAYENAAAEVAQFDFR